MCNYKSKNSLRLCLPDLNNIWLNRKRIRLSASIHYIYSLPCDTKCWELLALVYWKELIAQFLTTIPILLLFYDYTCDKLSEINSFSLYPISFSDIKSYIYSVVFIVTDEKYISPRRLYKFIYQYMCFNSKE